MIGRFLNLSVFLLDLCLRAPQLLVPKLNLATEGVLEAVLRKGSATAGTRRSQVQLGNEGKSKLPKGEMI
jgi:hypothetical protein